MLLLQLVTGFFAHAYPASFPKLDHGFGYRVQLFVEEHYVGSDDRGFLGDDSALGIALGGFGVLFDHVHFFDNDAPRLGIGSQDMSFLAFVITRDHDHIVTFLEVQFLFHLFLLQHFRSKGYDLHIVSFAEFAGYWTKDTGSLGFVLVVDNNGCVIRKTDV